MPTPAKNNPARTPEPTAAQVFAQRTSDIARLLDVIQQEVARHAENAKADPTSWAHAGNLGKVRSDLINTAAFLSGMDPEQVVAFLGE